MTGPSDHDNLRARLTAFTGTLLRLRQASGPDGDIDKEIALIAGWVRLRGNGTNAPRKDAEEIWLNPEGDPAEVPPFTQNIDVALEFLEEVSPNWEGGFSWEAGMGSAKVNDAPFVTVASPTLAICIQAVLLLAKKIKAEWEQSPESKKQELGAESRNPPKEAL